VALLGWTMVLLSGLTNGTLQYFKGTLYEHEVYTEYRVEQF